MKIYDALQARGRIGPGAVVPETRPLAKRASGLPLAAKHDSEAIRAGRRGFLSRMDLLSLFQSIQGMLNDDSPRVLQFMSATPNEGTSTITRELAAAVAELTGLRVLLVTMPNGTRWPTDSLSGTLLGNEPLESVLRRVPGDSYLTAEMGIIPQENSHSFLAQRLPDLFERLLSRVDVIIIDGAPALADHAGLATVRHVGGVVLVVEAERTSSSAAKHARQMIEANEGHVLGVVLNKRRSYFTLFKNITHLMSRRR